MTVLLGLPIPAPVFAQQQIVSIVPQLAGGVGWKCRVVLVDPKHRLPGSHQLLAKAAR